MEEEEEEEEGAAGSDHTLQEETRVMMRGRETGILDEALEEERAFPK